MEILLNATDLFNNFISIEELFLLTIPDEEIYFGIEHVRSNYFNLITFDDCGDVEVEGVTVCKDEFYS